MTTHFSWGTTLLRWVCCLAVLLTISTAALAQPAGTVTRLVLQMCYQFIFDGKPEEAIAVFKANVERYPTSANVYDSLAEAYERQGQLDLADPLYDKARTLGEQNNDPNAATYKANYERVHAKLKETTMKQ